MANVTSTTNTPSTKAPASGAVPSNDLLDQAREILQKEGDGIVSAAELLDDRFITAVELIAHVPTRVAVTGIGKAGIVGQKIAATLSSTGTPAYVLNCVEALHGDLGMIHPSDVMLCLSNSGESDELARLLPAINKIGCKIIIITGRPTSRCARLSDVVINTGVQSEACPLGLAPSTSTTVMLAVGDALALTVMRRKGFRKEQYAAFHPGGALGRSLVRVSEIMRTGSDCPRVRMTDTVRDSIDAQGQAPRRSGACAVVDDEGRLAGIFTDGDLKRLIAHSDRPWACLMKDVMTQHPKRARNTDAVGDVVRTIQEYLIDELLVVDGEDRLVGLIDVQDLLAAGFTVFDAE